MGTFKKTFITSNGEIEEREIAHIAVKGWEDTAKIAEMLIAQEYRVHIYFEDCDIFVIEYANANWYDFVVAER